MTPEYEYHLFAGSTYYPCGGFLDYKGSYQTQAEALCAAANTDCDWWHIVFGGAILNEGERK